MNESAPRDPGHEDRHLVSVGGGQADLPHLRANRRIAVARGQVDEPGLDRPDPILRDAGNLAGIRDSKEESAASGVGQRHEFAGELLGIRGHHAVFVETDLLELGAVIFPGAKLVEDLILGIEHGVRRVSGASAPFVSRCCT